MLERPPHPYTKALVESDPVADPEARREREPVQGEPPSPIAPPPGCPYHPRCPLAVDRCKVERAPLMETPEGGESACWELDRA